MALLIQRAILNVRDGYNLNFWVCVVVSFSTEMSKDYFTILQIPKAVRSAELEQAYRASRVRYERLTARGPLRSYRKGLLADTDRAYEALRRPETGVGRVSAGQGVLRNRVQPPNEDDFCREVIYRLEGDLIRYDSRHELLELAHQWGIHAFRANMLIAQIVEAVRQNKLYESEAEAQGMATDRSKKALPMGRLILAAAVAAVIINVLLMRYLGSTS